MQRTIVTPALLAPAALADLKQWLGITTSRDDAPLEAVLRAALELCEGFTGTMPLASGCEEILAVQPGWHTLSTRPVRAITGMDALAADGTRATIAVSAYALDIAADGTGRIHLTGAVPAGRIIVRFVAGMADDWAGLPEMLRHGIIRLAAHQHRQREGAGGDAMPPASVAALWRPWRRVRLA